MTRERILSRLRHLKVLAEQGVGGEATTAQELYEKISNKYNVTDEELEKLNVDKVEKYWFKYKDELSKRLATQIFYMVTGSAEYWVKTDKRYKMLGVECTQLEHDEIVFLHTFYMKHFKEELDIFFKAFVNVNNLFPNSSARLYKPNSDDEDTKLTQEEIKRLNKMFNMSQGMEKVTPVKQIEEKEYTGG